MTSDNSELRNYDRIARLIDQMVQRGRSEEGAFVLLYEVMMGLASLEKALDAMEANLEMYLDKEKNEGR